VALDGPTRSVRAVRTTVPHRVCGRPVPRDLSREAHPDLVPLRVQSEHAGHWGRSRMRCSRFASYCSKAPSGWSGPRTDVAEPVYAATGFSQRARQDAPAGDGYLPAVRLRQPYCRTRPSSPCRSDEHTEIAALGRSWLADEGTSRVIAPANEVLSHASQGSRALLHLRELEAARASATATCHGQAPQYGPRSQELVPLNRKNEYSL
jgi:hypothetical protein